MTQLRQSSKQSGKTFVGLVIGLIAGLAIAVIVALYITRGPNPLVSKHMPLATGASGTSSANNAPARDLSSLIVPSKPAALSPASRAEEEDQFDDSQIIEVPPEEGRKAPKKSAPSVARTPTPSTRPSTPSDTADTGYYLQVGAYKTDTGAEQQRAHLALQGFESKVSQRSSSDLTYYRVRLGPFAKFDEMNSVRQRLTEEGVNSIVIRFRKQAS